MNMTRVQPNLETDGEVIWGCATIDALDLFAQWYYRAIDDVVSIGEITIDGLSCKLHEDDPLVKEIEYACLAAVKDLIGHGEIDAEIAHDEAVDRAIDEAIERRHDGE